MNSTTTPLIFANNIVAKMGLKCFKGPFFWRRVYTCSCCTKIGRYLSAEVPRAFLPRCFYAHFSILCLECNQVGWKFVGSLHLRWQLFSESVTVQMDIGLLLNCFEIFSIENFPTSTWKKWQNELKMWLEFWNLHQTKIWGIPRPLKIEKHFI